jgi:hypothetical protein
VQGQREGEAAAERRQRAEEEEEERRRRAVRDEEEARIAALVARTRREIIDTCLTFLCGSCGGAILHWDGCAAVRHQCGAYFCGCCFEVQAVDNHDHLRRCPLNPTHNYYPGEGTIAAAHRTVRIQRVKAALKKAAAAAGDGAVGARVAAEAAQSVARELQDLGGLKPTDVMP